MLGLTTARPSPTMGLLVQKQPAGKGLCSGLIFVLSANSIFSLKFFIDIPMEKMGDQGISLWQ
jgi:hypothetical protein